MLIKDNSLPPDILKVSRHQATEPPFTGEYFNPQASGTYLCRSCGVTLFRADTQFSSSCGWPSFDEAFAGAVLERVDSDGQRREIICAACRAHLGHVFDKEGFTLKNRRFCVNSLSLDFVEDDKVIDTAEAILAGGCFWGIQYYLDTLKGVLKTEVGYTGGHTTYPSYQSVCSGNTGHFEAIRVVYDLNDLDYQTLLKFFFEIHDPTQNNRQGPDIGPQYQSAVFYYNDEQRAMAQQMIQLLMNKNIVVTTKLLPVNVFWRAELSHQNYYKKSSGTPYCHGYVKRF